MVLTGEKITIPLEDDLDNEPVLSSDPPKVHEISTTNTSDTLSEIAEKESQLRTSLLLSSAYQLESQSKNHHNYERLNLDGDDDDAIEQDRLDDDDDAPPKPQPVRAATAGSHLTHRLINPGMFSQNPMNAFQQIIAAELDVVNANYPPQNDSNGFGEDITAQHGQSNVSKKDQDNDDGNDNKAKKRVKSMYKGGKIYNIDLST
jgi:hypothetical protein